MKAGAIKKYKRLTSEAIDNENIETKPWRCASVKAKFYFKTNRRRDCDNAVGSLKSVYDGIVVSGLLKDDSPEYMQREWPDFLVDKVSPRVEITIAKVK